MKKLKKIGDGRTKLTRNIWHRRTDDFMASHPEQDTAWHIQYTSFANITFFMWMFLCLRGMHSRGISDNFRSVRFRFQLSRLETESLMKFIANSEFIRREDTRFINSGMISSSETGENFLYSVSVASVWIHWPWLRWGELGYVCYHTNQRSSEDIEFGNLRNDNWFGHFAECFEIEHTRGATQELSRCFPTREYNVNDSPGD